MERAVAIWNIELLQTFGARIRSSGGERIWGHLEIQFVHRRFAWHMAQDFAGKEAFQRLFFPRAGNPFYFMSSLGWLALVLTTWSVPSFFLAILLSHRDLVWQGICLCIRR